MKAKPKHPPKNAKARRSNPADQLITSLKNENQRLLQRISLLETLCTTAQSRIKTLEAELDPDASEKLTGDELEAILHAVLESSGPLRRKRRQV